MKEHKFKVGDRVKCIKSDLYHPLGDERTISLLHGMKEYDSYGFLGAAEGMVLNDKKWTIQKYWKLIDSDAPQRYMGELREGMKVEVVVESQPPYRIKTGTYTVIEFFRGDAKLMDSDGNYYYASHSHENWWGQGEKEAGYYWYVSRVISESAAPRRYTGELRTGMRVEIKRTDGCDMGVGAHVVVEGGAEPRLERSGSSWRGIRQRQDGEWWATNDTMAYISHVISEPEDKPMPSMHIGADGFAIPMPIMSHHHYQYCGTQIRISPYMGAIQKLMEGLRSIPAKIKRILNPNYKAFYQLGWVDEELDLTGEGQVELLNMLLDKHEDELGALAKKEVARRKKHFGQDEE